jgi:hypothetical protein
VSALSSFKRAMNRTMGLQRVWYMPRNPMRSWSIELRNGVFRFAPGQRNLGTPPGHRYWNRRRLREAGTMDGKVQLHAEREEQERRMG